MDFLYENGEAGGKRAHMVFPEHYDEAVENTPARILFTEYHGSGTNYRQCFYSKELDFAEYDSLFDMAVVMDKAGGPGGYELRTTLSSVATE